jgi:predicted DNA binding CopG/RHH family protein
MKSPTKSCQLDPIPTWLLKECIDVLIAPITTIINKCLGSSTMPNELKIAHITPLLKKLSLLVEFLKNYRPVSGLPFISKIMEKHFDGQMSIHDKTYDLADHFQSAYTEFCSTETALLRVQSDLLMAVDTKGAALLILLDLSAAFDTIDHEILLTRLEYAFGLKDQALAWMRSYLTDRQQCVVVNGAMSNPKALEFGFPQGSVLGPRNWKRYSAPIGVIARKHGLSFHLYADDM